MAKRSKAKTKSFSLYNSKLLLFALIAICCAWLWYSDQADNWKDQALQYIDNKEIATLEVRFSPEYILEKHAAELIGDKRVFKQTVLKYYPYLLLDVKYMDAQKTHEGFLLWGLHEGEMVLNTDTWETTHGFKDCLDCQANRQDLKILRTLAKFSHPLSLDELQKELKLEREITEMWVQSAKQKHLVVQKGQLVQLHFENPKILVTPQTRMQQQIVGKLLGEGQKAYKQYSRSQILQLAQAAFGNEFKIRNEKEIFLPVYQIEVLNPDGSIQTTEWNALNGQRLFSTAIFK